MNCRVEFTGDHGTVRYEGPLQHLEKKSEDIWIGIEWDLSNRGKNNGCVGGYKYFEANELGGSLVKKNKVNFGMDIL